MNILSIEMSSSILSISLQIQGKKYNLEAPSRNHSASLTSYINTLFYENAIDRACIKALAFGKGPGSFTGIRIAAAFCQAMAYVHKLPIAPVCSLQAMAQYAFESYGLKQASVAVNAFNNQQIYFAEFKLNTACQLMQHQTLPELLPASKLISHPQRKHLCINETTSILLRSLQANPFQSKQFICEPHSEMILLIAQQDFNAGRGVDAPHALPSYCHEPYVRKT